ncbi:MAG: PAS domain-containing protein, partial [Halohasta sp.]
MWRLLNRVVVTGSEGERAESASGSDTSEAVEWTDISEEATESVAGGSTSGTDRPDSESTAEAIGSTDDQLVGHVLEAVDDPTLLVDAEGRITHINGAACELYGTSESAAVGRSAASLHDGEPLVEQVCETGREINEREEAIVDGTERMLNRTVTPFAEGGSVVGAMEQIAVLTDDSGQEAKADELEAYQRRVLEDLQDKIVRLAEGDLTIDPTVPEPTADFEEMRTTHEEFAELNGHLTTAVDNYRQV